ncbi:MAG: hypothetical protein WAK55_10630, partial [Xanthobacteraceae bacterium]
QMNSYDSHELYAHLSPAGMNFTLKCAIPSASKLQNQKTPEVLSVAPPKRKSSYHESARPES